MCQFGWRLLILHGKIQGYMYALTRWIMATPAEFHSSFHESKTLSEGEPTRLNCLREYIPTTSPKWESPQSTFKHHQCTSISNLNFNSQNSWTPLQSKGSVVHQHYMTKEATRYKVREQEVSDQRVKNEVESVDTAHPTQINPRRSKLLDGRMGFIHNS